MKVAPSGKEGYRYHTDAYFATYIVYDLFRIPPNAADGYFWS